MAEAAKVIRIELRVGGGTGGGGTRKPKEKKIPKSKTMLGRMQLTANQLAGAGAITFATHLLSEGFSMEETMSYNSAEKTNMMLLDMSKKAVSSTLTIGGYILGGPVGAAIGMSINQLVVQPLSRMGEISIQRHLDHTRATNRFYLTGFAGKGNYTFDYANETFVNENLQKTINTVMYKRSFR